ncbi:hypothetical protein BC829DRAFT_296651 [Chytridium lagenaria]|nr:hypothetical protein BC829DRAFT_296651 [Chytridium lagenaria]
MKRNSRDLDDGGSDADSDFDENEWIEKILSLRGDLQELFIGMKFSDPACQRIGIRLLQDVTGLIAYENPADAPQRYLFDEAQREKVADVVNSGILASLNHPNYTLPSLNILMRQLILARTHTRTNVYTTPLYDYDKQDASAPRIAKPQWNVKSDTDNPLQSFYERLERIMLDTHETVTLDGGVPKWWPESTGQAERRGVLELGDVLGEL